MYVRGQGVAATTLTAHVCVFFVLPLHGPFLRTSVRYAALWTAACKAVWPLSVCLYVSLPLCPSVDLSVCPRHKLFYTHISSTCATYWGHRLTYSQPCHPLLRANTSLSCLTESVSCCHSSSFRHQAHTSLGVVRLASRRRIYAHEVDNVHVVVYWTSLSPVRNSFAASFQLRQRKALFWHVNCQMQRKTIQNGFQTSSTAFVFCSESKFPNLFLRPEHLLD